MRAKSYETFFPHPASYPYQSRRDEEIEAKINKSNQPIRPHQYYEGSRGSRPSVIYVDEPVHVDARDETRYSKKSFLVLATVLIILGLITIISQIVLMTTVYYDGFWPTYYEVRFLDYLGTGLWCGGFFVISGAVGLLAGIKPTDGRVLAFLVTAIFSSLMCIPLICTSLLGTLITPYATIHLAFFILQIVLSLAVAAMSIAASVISCGKICNKPNSNLEPAVLYKATGPLPSNWPKY